jgi:hypothetical protein
MYKTTKYAVADRTIRLPVMEAMGLALLLSAADLHVNSVS